MFFSFRNCPYAGNAQNHTSIPINIKQHELYNKKYADEGTGCVGGPLEDHLEAFVQWYESAFQDRSGLQILDLGGGPCRLGVALQSSFATAYATYTNLELSENAVAAGRRLGFHNVRVLPIPDDGQLPIAPDSYDIVHCSHVIEHLVNPDVVFEEAMRILRPGGYLFIGTPNIAGWLGRFLVACGWQGYGQEISTRFAVAGKGPLARMVYGEGGIGFHLRVFSAVGLRDMMRLHGFTRSLERGVRTFEFQRLNNAACVLVNAAAVIDFFLHRRFTLACNIVAVGQKPRSSVSE